MTEKRFIKRGPRPKNTTTYFFISLELSGNAPSQTRGLSLFHAHLAHPSIYAHLKREFCINHLQKHSEEP